MAEKKYVIENAELMAEWDWEKNNALEFFPEALTLAATKKLGGNVCMDTVGNRK